MPAGADEDAAEAAAADAAAAVAAMEDAMLERSQELQAADDRIVAAQEKARGRDCVGRAGGSA